MTVYQRLIRASRSGIGIHLSPEEVGTLVSISSVRYAASLDDQADDASKGLCHCGLCVRCLGRAKTARWRKRQKIKIEKIEKIEKDALKQ